MVCGRRSDIGMGKEITDLSSLVTSSSFASLVAISACRAVVRVWIDAWGYY